MSGPSSCGPKWRGIAPRRSNCGPRQPTRWRGEAARHASEQASARVSDAEQQVTDLRAKGERAAALLSLAEAQGNGPAVRAAELDRLLAEAQGERHRLQHELADVLRSTFWQITAPDRRITSVNMALAEPCRSPNSQPQSGYAAILHYRLYRGPSACFFARSRDGQHFCAVAASEACVQRRTRSVLQNQRKQA